MLATTASVPNKWQLTCPQCFTCILAHISITTLWMWAIILTSMPSAWTFPEQNALYKTTIAFGVFNATAQCVFYFTLLGVKCTQNTRTEICKIVTVVSSGIWIMMNLWFLFLAPFFLYAQIALGSNLVFCYCIVWFCVMIFWVLVGYILVVAYVWPGCCISPKIQDK